ncbi:MAG: MMPL family transporter [Phycisphaerae bacterium]|nr:MMPL family transporter [Phycisphaerae bacterium]
MTFLHRYSIRHPFLVLVIALLAVAVAAPGMLRLTLRTDGYALVPEKRPEVAFDKEVRAEFNSEDLLVVLIRSDHPDGIFNVDTLRLIQELTREFQALEGIRPDNVSSLETEYSHRVKQGTLDFRRFLEPLPQTPAELLRLRGDLERIELHTGTIVSYDGTAASILVGVPAEQDRTEFYGTVQDIIAAHGPRSETFHVIGAPVAESLLGLHILEDLGVPDALLGVRSARDADESRWALPRSTYELRVFIGRQIGLVPIAIVIILIVFAISFRSLTAALLPLMEVGACLVAVFGLMGWFEVPIYLTIAVMPVILTAIGVADEIHVFARYVQELRGRPESPHRDALRVTMDEMWVPVVKTSITTAVGFLSFALSPIGPVRAFGIFTAVGIIFCMLWSLSVIPALLTLCPPRWFVNPSRAKAAPGPRAFAWLGTATRRGRYLIIAASIVALVAAPYGVARVMVQDSWIDGFAPDSEFHEATQYFNEQFLGTHILLVRVETEHQVITGQLSGEALDHHRVALPADAVDEPAALVGHRIFLYGKEVKPAASRPGDPRRQRYRSGKWKGWIEGTDVTTDEQLVLTIQRKSGSPRIALRPDDDELIRYEIRIEPLLSPEVIRRIAALENFIEAQRQHTVGGVIGTAAYLETTHFISRGLRDETRHIPDKPEKIQWLWGQYERIRGPERLRQVLGPDGANSLVTVFLKNANFVDVQALLDTIRAYEREHLKPHGLTLGFAGDIAVSQTLIRAIVQTQVWSLMGSLLGVLVVTTLLSRSLHWGVYCVLPCALAVLINFAVMGWTNTPLGVATSMFAGMTLGIGVDFAIHLLERYRLALSRGWARRAALADALTVAGPAIFIDAAAIALGFGVMTLSQVPANARLGALVVLSIVNCLLGTLLVLPALLLLWSPRVRPPRV